MTIAVQTLAATLGPLAAAFDTIELEQLAQSLTRHGLRCIRPRPDLPLSELPMATRPVPWSSQGRFLADSHIRPGGLLQFAVGDYAVQDAASLLPLALMELQPGQQAIDCCAAPGGKSAALLEHLQGDGLLVSNEVIASRVDTLQLTLARTGYSNYMITHQPLERIVSTTGDAFDCVLVDAPCTGQSLVARGKQSLSAFSDKQISHSAARQQSILRDAIQLVRPGGRLIYSTCTFAYAENEAILQWLVDLLPQWQPIVKPNLASWQTPGFPGCYRLWPHRDECAGGFAAGLIRPIDDQALPMTAGTPSRSERSGRSERRPWQASPRPACLVEWGRVPEDALFYQQQQQLSWFDPRLPSDWVSMAYTGIEVATQFGEHWQPAYPLATCSSLPFAAHQMTELTNQEAITYYTGTSLHRPGPAGWQILTWNHRPIAWSKQVGNQLKNHLPKPLRQPRLAHL